MSEKAMKLATELNRYFTSMNGVDVPERVSVPRDEWRALFAALEEQPAPVQGWKLVPVDAVPEIMEAAMAVHDKWAWRNFPAMWQAILSAAPTPPAQPAQPQQEQSQIS